MKKVLCSIALVLTFALLVPLNAMALCSVSGEVVRVFDSTTSTTAYLKTSALTSIYYFGSTTDIDLRNAIRSCENSRHRCNLVGNATSCPSTGTGRSIGTLVSVTANP